jgi:hypothetical protein
MNSQQLKIGTGVSDISPAPGIPQGGWGAQIHQRSNGNDLPLQARALVLDNGVERIAIVDVDAIGFDAAITDKIMQAISSQSSLPRDRIRFSCTHTHSGPNTFRLPMIREGLEMALSYIESLPNQIAGAVWQATQTLQPARCAASHGGCDINASRRCRDDQGRTFVGSNQSGPVDRTVSVIRFDALEGAPLAAIMHYACHPTTMAWDNEYVTPDYPGAAKQVVEESLGVPCLFLQGCTGDLGPRRGFTGDLRVYRRLGTILGHEAAKLAWNIDTQPTRLSLKRIQESGARIGIYDEIPIEQPAPVLRMICKIVDLPAQAQPHPEEAEGRAQLRRDELKAVLTHGTEQEIRDATARATQAGMAADRARLYYGRSSFPLPMQAIRIGDIALLSVSGEPFHQIGLRIREQSPFAHTFVSGYSNGNFGYIPVREAFPEGGYEVETTPFSADAADTLVTAALDLLAELRALG